MSQPPVPLRPATSTTSVAGSCQQYQPRRVYTYATERNTWDNTPIHHTGSTTFRGRTARSLFTSHALAQWKYIGRIPKWMRLYPMQSIARTDAKLCVGNCKALRWRLQSFALVIAKLCVWDGQNCHRYHQSFLWFILIQKGREKKGWCNTLRQKGDFLGCFYSKSWSSPLFSSKKLAFPT